MDDKKTSAIDQMQIEVPSWHTDIRYSLKVLQGKVKIDPMLWGMQGIGDGASYIINSCLRWSSASDSSNSGRWSLSSCWIGVGHMQELVWNSNSKDKNLYPCRKLNPIRPACR
jgi:hypothetical protein